MFWLVPAAGNELRQSPPPGQASPLSCSPTPQPRSPRGLLVCSPGPRPGKGWRLRPWGPGCQGGPAPGLAPARSPPPWSSVRPGAPASHPPWCRPGLRAVSLPIRFLPWPRPKAVTQDNPRGREGPFPRHMCCQEGRVPSARDWQSPPGCAAAPPPTIKSRLKTGALLAAFNQLMG